MARHIKGITYAILALALLLTGCKSRKTLQGLDDSSIYTASIANLAAITPDTATMQHISANTTMNLSINGSSVSIKGKLRIKRGEGVQVSITPLGIVEAACIEFLPQKIQFINKLLKTYVELPYSEAKAIGLSGINYNVLEAIFLNYAFLPDGRPACNGLDEMKIEELDSSYRLTTERVGAMQYSFLVDKASGSLVSCSGESISGESVGCDYSSFAPIGIAEFPNRLSISFNGDEAIKLELGLSKTNNKEFNFSSRNINSSYKKQNIGDFIKSIK